MARLRRDTIGGDGGATVAIAPDLLPAARDELTEALPPPPRWRPSPAGIASRLTVHAVLLALVLALPILIPDVYLLVVAKAVTFMLLALSMNVLMGYAGQVSLGHSAFLGVGAFGAAYVLTILQMPFLVAMAAAVGLGVVAALVLGVVALRIRGLYLALVTIAYGLFAEESIFKIRGLTGGGAGQPADRPAFASGDLAYVYFGLGLVAIVWVLDWRLTSSKAGRAIQALRDDERVAASWGINITGYKLLAFVISGAIAGLAGAYFAASEGVVVSASFTFTLSLTIVLMTVIGGLGSRPGVIQGGIVFAALPTFLELAHSHWGSCAWWLPRGLEGLIGVGLAAGALAFAVGLFRGRSASLAGAVGRGVGAALLLAGGGFMLWATVTNGWCLYEHISGLLEPFVGALLLVLTLIFFPGGIAQQQEHTLRWLSFKPIHEPEHAA